MNDTGREKERSVHLERLTQLSRAFTYAMSLRDILDLAVKQAAELLHAEKAILLLADDDGVLHVSASFGVSDETVERFREALDESLVSRLRSLVGAQLAEGFVGVPLVSNGNVIGLLAVLRSELGLASGDEEWLLSALADQVAAPLENARLLEELEKIELIAENGRLFEAERVARQEAEAAREEADKARRQAEAARVEAEIARDLAQQSDKSKAAFLAAMSHDLRTPLNAIAGYVQLLKMGIRGPVTEEQSLDLDRISRNQQHLLAMVSEVLDFAKIGAGRVTYNYREVVMDSALRDAEMMVMPQMKAKSLEYRHDVSDGALTCRTDPDKLQQILINLLSNAIKFTPSGGSITTTMETSPDERNGESSLVRIQVTDTGLGIPEENLDMVFLPFVQINRQLNHPDEGIGLGLAISRELARGMGGDLTVVSEFEKGSTFTLSLPLEVSGASESSD